MTLNKNIIHSYLKNNFNIIYNNFTSNIYLSGGSVKELLLGMEVRDLDIVILADDDAEIENFIKKYNLEWQKNNFGGYKIKYGKLDIDIWYANDLYKCIQYNYDGLFYDIKNNLFIPFGFYDSIETNELKEINLSTKEKRIIVNEATKKRDKKRKEKILKMMKIIGDSDEKK